MESARVNPRERVWKSAGLFFCLKFSNNLGLVLLTSLFLKNYGAAGLPRVYILSNLLLITSQVLLLNFSRRRGFSLLMPLFVLLSGLLFLTAFLEFVNQPVLFLVALLLFMLYDVHATQGFADLIGQIMPLREAKEHLPSIYAAGSAGSIVSGLGIRLMMEYLRISQVFLGMILVCGVMWLILRSMRGLLAPEESREIAAPTGVAPTEGDRSPLGTETVFYCRLLVLFSFSAMLGRILSEFAYTTGVSQVMDSEKSLAGFLGIFGAGIDVTAIGLQTFVTGRLFSRVKLGWIMVFRAMGMALLTGIAWVAVSIYSILSVQFFLAVMTKSFALPAYALMLEPVPRRYRANLRKYVSIGDSSAYVLGGVLLMLLIGAVGPSGKAVVPINLSLVFCGLMFLHLFQAALASRLDFSYTGTVQETIATLEDRGDLEILQTMRFIPYSQRLGRLSGLLRDADEEVRFGAIQETSELAAHDAADLLLTAMISERSSRNLARAVTIIVEKLGDEGVEMLEDFLHREKEHRLVADVIEALGQSSQRMKLVPSLEKLMNHEHHRVRGTAIMVLLQAAMDPGVLERALDGLKELIGSLDPLARSTAAVVMGSAGVSGFVPSLIHLTRDDSEEVVKNAFSSLSRLGTQSSLEYIAQACQEPGMIGKAAQEIWKSLAGDSFRSISRLLGSLTSQERRDLGSWLGRVSVDRSFTLAQKVVRLENRGIRETIIRNLSSMSREEQDMLNRCLVETSEDGVEIRLSGILDDLEKAQETGLPQWVEIIPMVGGINQGEYLGFLRRSLMKCWVFGILGVKARRQSLLETSEARVAQERTLKNTWQRIFHLFALGLPDPSNVLATISKACSGDPFVRSLALEHLESVVPKELWQLFQPLVLFENDESMLLREATAMCGQDPLEMNEIVLRSSLLGVISG